MDSPRRSDHHSTKPVKWGSALRIRAEQEPGGTFNLVQSIQAEIGHGIGSRPSFLTLYKHPIEPAALSTDTERRRAWYLLVAMGENPADWGVSDSVLAPAEWRHREETARNIRARVLEHPKAMDIRLLYEAYS